MQLIDSLTKQLGKKALFIQQAYRLLNNATEIVGHIGKNDNGAIISGEKRKRCIYSLI